MGWAEVVHPFHPFRGQRCEILKIRRVSGIETLILRHPERGSYAVAREWTDRADPRDLSVRRLEIESLLQLAVLIEQLEQSEVVDE
ncbi:MAG: DUF5372 family protein [Gammaproteobacteria bacterium]